MHKLMIIGIEGNELIAVSPTSGIELGRQQVHGESTNDHEMAAVVLLHKVFDSLNAEGFPRATVD